MVLAPHPNFLMSLIASRALVPDISGVSVSQTKELHNADFEIQKTILDSLHLLVTLVGIYRNRNDDLWGTIVTYIGRLSRLESVLFYFCNSKKRTHDGIDRDTDVVGFLPSFHGATDMEFHRG